MRKQSSQRRAGACVLLYLLLGFVSESNRSVMAQDSERGTTARLSFSGSSNTLGQIYKLDASAGYKFNKFFSVDAGLPVYFENASVSSSSAGFSSKNGIGNAYVDLRLALSGPSAYFSSILRGAVPTGDKDEGFSTGRVTVDWTNYADVTVGRWTPFGSIGLANTVRDTHFFSRPFSTLGFVTEFEGGANYEILKHLDLGASGYAVVPNGQQKVFSKLIKRQSSGAQGAVQGRGQGKKGVFESGSVTIGNAEIAKDHGISMWVDLYPSPYASFELGYSRSVHYAFDTVFFNIGLNLGKLARKAYQH